MTAQSWLEEQYADGTHMAWHMSVMTPEVGAALVDGWLTPSGVVVDLGDTGDLGGIVARLRRPAS